MNSARLHISRTYNRDSLSLRDQWFNDLQKFEKVQLTFSNITTQEQNARIWAANQGFEVSQGTQSFSTDIYPQVIAFNSFNNYYYIANQLAGSIEVFDQSGLLIRRIQLEPDFVGLASLVDLTVDDSTGSVFAIGSISNTLYWINPQLEIEKSIAVSNRPISVEFNSTTGLIHIAHLTEAEVCIIDPLLETINTVEVQQEPIDLEINQSTGEWIVVNSASNSLSLFDATNQNIGIIENIGESPFKIRLQELNQAVVITETSKEVYLIDIDNQLILENVQLDGKPVDVQLLPESNFIILTNEPNQLIVLGSNLEELSSKEISHAHSGTAIDSGGSTLLIPNPISNTIELILIDGNNNPIVAGENYFEVLKDFQHNPVLVKHLKVHFSGNSSAPFIRIGSRSPSGKTASRIVSMNKYRSPQHYASIYELTEFENEIIDGKTFWEVLIPPEQQITLVLYYR